MTTVKQTVYEKGKHYKMCVLFTSRSAEQYINVKDGGDGGQAFKVEVTGNLVCPLSRLKNKVVDLVCTDVTDRGPEFALERKYFVQQTKGSSRGGNVGCKEGLKVEFKKSLVYSPVTSQADSDQPFEIAKVMAAFMNTKGGTLYIGVDDEGFISGIENDLPLLGSVPLLMNSKSDAAYKYPANIDGYRRKLTNAVLWYLGKSAAALMGEIEEVKDSASGRSYVRVSVEASDDVVYLGREQSIVYRSQASVTYLTGAEREKYVRHRFFMQGEKSAVERLAAANRRILQLERELARAKSASRNAAATRPVRLPSKAGKPRIGQVAKSVFPVLFAKNMVSEEDVAFLVSKKAEKRFKTKSNPIIKEIRKDAVLEAKDGKGRKRFYSDIVLPYKGKNYLLTSQWFKEGLDSLVSWLAAHGIDGKRIDELCGKEVGKRE